MSENRVHTKISSFYKNFLNIISNSSQFIYFSHENADPDALGSILGMKLIIDKIKKVKNPFLIYLNGLSKLSMRLVDRWGLELDLLPELPIEEFLPILVDGQEIILHSGEKSKMVLEKSIVIDHHNIVGKPIAPRLKLIDDNVQSNCELVYKLLKYAQIIPPYPINEALLAGILFDSGRLKYATNSTINIINDLLMNSNLQLKDINNFMNTRMDYSEKIARLKAANRVELHKIEEIIIAFSKLSSYEASACRGLIGLGADIAVVIYEKKGNMRVSSRGRQIIYEKYGIDLSKIMKDVGIAIKGSGGGHALAAAAKGRSIDIDLLALIKKKIENLVNN
mgnify:FL=1